MANQYKVFKDKGVEIEAALEVLAIVSYKQPITRAEVEEIRGVKSERILWMGEG